MTAMSLIVQPHAAYLLTDTAYYLADGTVVGFAPKVTELIFGPVVTGPPARAAFALTGIITPDHVKAKIAKREIGDIRDFIDALPAIVRDLSAAIPSANRAPGVSDEDSILLALALWDDASATPYGFLIGNETCPPVAAGQMEPFRVVRMNNYVLQQGCFNWVGVDWSNPEQFDAIRDGGDLLDAQRADPFGDDVTQFCGVGGQGILTEIGPGGVRYHLLRTWPDRVGERIAA